MSKDDATTPPEDEQAAVEKQVDAMMDPAQPDEPVKGAPPLDIFAGQTPPAAEAESAKEPSKDIADTPDSYEDQPTEQAVDDIVAKEGDELLAVSDANAAPEPAPEHHNWLAMWWQNRKLRYASLALVFALVVAATLWPTSRYMALNTVGVRSRLSITVLDNTTQLPLKNVSVTLGSLSATTDKNGQASLSDVKLGPATLVIHKTAFAAIKKQIVVGWGSNPLGSVALNAAGDQYQFKVVDYFSNKPITDAEVSRGEATANTDKNGTAILTIDDPSSDNFSVTISASGYRNETATVTVGSSQTVTTALVSSQKDVYFTKQSGKYDLYKSDLDGKNKQLLLAGTGNENDQLSLVPHPTENEVALVSTRDNMRDADGYLLQALTLVNTTTGVPLTIDHSERIQIVDWIGEKLIYVRVRDGASAANPSRYQLMSYDFKNSVRMELAHANYFNDALVYKGVIYFASSNNYAGGQSQVVKINADGSGKQSILDAEAWNIVRSDYDSLNLLTQNGWYSYKLPATSATKLTAAPTITTSRLFIDGQDKQHSLWVDTRDGKGVLISHDISANKDNVVLTQPGLTYPLYWATDDIIIYRVSTQTESADYAVSLSTGTSKKITDVTNATGVSGWYY